MSNNRLEKNRQRWGFFCPQAANLIPQVACVHISHAFNPNGSLNLKFTAGKQSYLLHSEHPEQEADNWFAGLSLQNTSILYVYGIGLGYYYKAAKPWLQQSKKNILVFLEDDLEVLRLFFETETAEKIFADPQVRLFYLDWNHKESLFAEIVQNFFFQPFKLTALKSYAEQKKTYGEAASLLAYQTSMRSALMGEYISSGRGFFSNYYRNLFSMPSSFLGNSLFNQFCNLPAIICGAGPSLEKNLELLGTLKDKALIFAGGTAMNAINTKGILPHFGVGIDPNIFQYSRIIANQAFEVPFFYRNRMHHEALQLIHGEHLYVTGSGGYALSEWVEERLGIPAGVPLPEGFNVINFSLSIALAMGCNPIFFAGVDLAYSGEKSYAPGLFHHAIHDPKQDFRTKTTEEELVAKNDIHGEFVQTLWKWIHEALWFSQKRLENPQVKFYNCTEGGIGFPGISSISLKAAETAFLPKSYDMEGMVHCAIQSSPMPVSVTEERVLGILKELQAGLKECLESFSTREKIYIGMQLKAAMGGDVPQDYMTEEIAQLAASLNQNLAYRELLQIFESKYMDYSRPRFLDIDYDTSLPAADVHSRKIELHIQRCSFLQTTARINLESLEEALETVPLQAAGAENENVDIPSAGVEGTYAFADLRLKVQDPELGIDYASLEPSSPAQETYPDGSLKSQWHILEGRLHGPSTYYFAGGQIAAESWFIEGKKQGKARFYYPAGKVHSRLRYKDGAKEGLQEYFYPNGHRKSILNYKNGLLDGVVRLFYPNGKMRRELFFDNGRRQGKERLWNRQGLLLIEAGYENDRPVGTAREWYENGNLAKEIIYDSGSKRLTYRRWDEGGAPWKPEVLLKEDYFDKVAKQTLLLTESLGKIVQDMRSVSAALPVSAGNAEIEEEMRQVEKQMEALREKGKEVQFESGIDPDNQSEAIWKSDSMKQEIQKHVESMSARMGQQISAMHELIHLTTQILEEKRNRKFNEGQKSEDGH